MLKIRLKRTGKRGQPHYRVVVTQSSNKRSGASVAEIGYYNPRSKPSTFEIDQVAAKEWLSKGAQPSDTVAQYLVKLKVMKAPTKGSTKPVGKKKKKAVETEEAKA